MPPIPKNALNGWGSFNTSTLPLNDTMVYFFAKPEITTEIVPIRKASIIDFANKD